MMSKILSKENKYLYPYFANVGEVRFTVTKTGCKHLLERSLRATLKKAKKKIKKSGLCLVLT
jgi:hypothetical protein